jgi:hypothetical protein
MIDGSTISNGYLTIKSQAILPSVDPSGLLLESEISAAMESRHPVA